MPGCRIGTKVAKVLALELAYLGQLSVLNLTGEYYNRGADKVVECMLVMLAVSGANVIRCACMPIVTLFVLP